MKPRKSTTILLSLWVATFVLYLFVKPATPEHNGFSPIGETISKTVISSTPHR